MSQYNSIGKLVATFGVKGEVILSHRLGAETDLQGLETFFIENKKDEMLPYFVEYTRAKNEEEVYIKIEGIESKEAAGKLLQKTVWLSEEDFRQYADATSPISFLGYHIIDQDVDLGEILEIIEQPHQVLCRIDLEGNEALIPLHQDTLLEIDQDEKRIYVELPDGLLDIYR
jgi:16S rRNA processing protein RimM